MKLSHQNFRYTSHITYERATKVNKASFMVIITSNLIRKLPSISNAKKEMDLNIFVVGKT